ncbi:hypothetical protein MITS9504_03267 [Synechococcus sp. MIT S9504]|nr:hypothetical protein MITS9504_03267 [Synechococcus sp. MIT S9504]
MQVQVPGGGLSDPGSDGWQSKTFMGRKPVTVVEPPELTIHLQEIDRFVQSLFTNGGHQGFQPDLRQDIAQGPADGSQRRPVHPHESTRDDECFNQI